MATTSVSQESSSLSLPCDQVLRIAQTDALKAYRDLSGYQITILRKSDGWHVDFDLVQPGMAGGGPHYVIDAQNGDILSKRYEQ